MLKGEKVYLRALERDDLKRLHELNQTVDLVMLGDGRWEPEPLAKMEREFDKHLDREVQARFVIEVEGRVIGSIGLHHCNVHEGMSQFGIGIFDPDYVGKGYGRDAIKVLLDWSFRIQNYRRIWLEAMAVNERALRAYRACGFTEEGRLRQHSYYNGEYVDVILMGVLRSEWEARRIKQARR